MIPLDVPKARSWKVTISHPAMPGAPSPMDFEAPGAHEAVGIALHEFSMRTGRNLGEIASVLVEQL